MKKFLSFLMSMTFALNAVPVISNAEDTENPGIIHFDSLPCYIDGKTVGFIGGDNYDFVTVTAPDKKFTTERNDNSFTFTPEQDGTFIVSMVWLEESIIYYPIEIFYDLMPGITSPAGYIDGKCNYFYPHIENYEITYNSETGTEIELIGYRNYINDKTASEIASGKMGIIDDYVEMETDDIFNDGGYYALATRISEMPFIYFDYGDENKEDKSVLCIKNLWAWDDAVGAVSVSGNAEKTKSFSGGSSISGDLMQVTCDIVFYTLIEPTGDGLAEIYYNPNYNNPCDVYIPPVSVTLTIENGLFIPDIMTTPDDLMTGDTNFDNTINIADAVLFQKYILGKTKFTSTQYIGADMNADGSVDIFDMVLLRQEIFGSQPVIVEPVCTYTAYINDTYRKN